jgi:hypothetical protein
MCGSGSASSLSTQPQGIRIMCGSGSASSLSTQPQGIRIMCGSVTLCLSVRWVLFQSSPACWSSIKVTSSSFLQKITSSRHDLAN